MRRLRLPDSGGVLSGLFTIELVSRGSCLSHGNASGIYTFDNQVQSALLSVRFYLQRENLICLSPEDSYL